MSHVALAAQREIPLGKPIKTFVGRDAYYWSSRYRNSATEYVDGEASLRIDTVVACIRVLAESIASLPLTVYRRVDDYTMEKAKDLPIYDLLRWQANAEMTSYEFRHWLMVDALLYGFGMAQIVTNEAGEPVALYPMRSRYVNAFRVEEPNSVFDEEDVGKIFYTYKEYLIPDSHVLKIDAFTSASLLGESLTSIGSQTLGSSAAADRYAGEWFSNANSPSGFVEFDTRLTEEQYERFLGNWRDNYSGKGNRHSVPIIEGGHFKPISINHEAAQLLETRKFYRSSIAGLFRVPAHLINDLERATFSNVEHQDIGFVKHSLRPWAVKWEQSIKMKLLPQNGRDELFVKHNFSDLLRGDLPSRYNSYSSAIEHGFLSPNEVRGFEDLNPYEGGDAYRINAASKRVEEDEIQGEERRI